MKKVMRIFATLIIALVIFASFIHPLVLNAQCEECDGCPERELEPTISTNSSSAPGYCSSHGGSHLYEYIQSVSYSTKPGTITITVLIYIANPTGCVAGQPCPEYDNSPEYINAWIDWDGDKVFESDERILDAALTGYLGINYYGSMSTSNIVTIPSDAVSSTWMRVNLGWGHDPNNPCEYSWTWGDVVDKKVKIAIKPPEIEEIIVTGIPDAKNPMTNDPSVAGEEKIKLEAKITPAEGFEVTEVSWSGDVKAGEGNPYEYSAAPGTHGKKKVVCTITYKNKVTGEIGTDTKTKEFDLFFVKDADENSDGVDNWYHYWSSSDDAACSFDRTSVTYRYGGGSYTGNTFGQYNGNPNNPVYTIYNRATMAESYNAAGLNIDRRGIDCVEATLEHEREHQRTDAKWQPGGEWHTLYGPRTTGAHGNDRDGDELPNQWEVDNAALGFDPDNAFSFPGFPYGDDEEVWVEMVAQGRTGVAANDWANPGKQSDPEYKRIVTENGTAATLSGTYVDYGRDTNGNGLYNYLSIEIGVNVVAAGTYRIFGNLYDQKENMLWAQNYTYLGVGTQSVILNFDGLIIHQHRVDGPYNLRYLTLSGSPQIDFIEDAYTTSVYSYTDFQKTDAGFTGSYSDYGKDTDGDGRYNYLTVEVAIDVMAAGNYTLIGWLYDNTGAEIVMANSSGYLDTGSQMTPLDFDGVSIYKHGVDGPYDLKYLTLYDENGALMDTLKYAYTTSVYKFTDFQEPPIPLIALTGNYWDSGTDINGDGIFDYLTIDVEVILANPGYCIIKARLMDGAGEEIIWAENTTHLQANRQIIQLNFDGEVIYNHGVDGPYYLRDVYIYHTGDPTQPDYVCDAYATKAYKLAQFGVWDYVFEDTFGRGTILKINTAHGFLQFVTLDKDFGIREATNMWVQVPVINTYHDDTELRLIAFSINTNLDYCRATAWDKQTGKIYLLFDKPGIE